MAKLVREIMNRELFSVGPDDTVDRALDGLLGLGITAAPVLDGEWRLLGVISLRDAVRVHGAIRVRERMSTPAAVVHDDATIAFAATLLGETGFRHLVVIDGRGRAVGMVSALDALRGLVGLPARHPAGFPHLDLRTGLYFSDELPLDEAHIEQAVDAPGVIALVHGEPGIPDRVVWVESASDVRSRLLDLVSTPQTKQPGLMRWLERGGLRFRVALVSDSMARVRAVTMMRHGASPDALR